MTAPGHFYGASCVLVARRAVVAAGVATLFDLFFIDETGPDLTRETRFSR